MIVQCVSVHVYTTVPLGSAGGGSHTRAVWPERQWHLSPLTTGVASPLTSAPAPRQPPSPATAVCDMSVRNVCV